MQLSVLYHKAMSRVHEAVMFQLVANDPTDGGCDEDIVPALHTKWK